MRDSQAPGTVLADRVQQRTDAIVEELMERQLREVPELWVTDDPALRDAVQRSTRDNTELMVLALREPLVPPRGLPDGARLEADVVAQCGAQVQALLRTYRLGEQVVLDHVFEVLDREPVAQPREALRELRAATLAVHAYMDAVMPLVAREYAAERARLEAWPGLRRLRLVQTALAGGDAQALGHDVGATQLALVAADPAGEAAVAATADALGVPHLAVRAPDGRLWAWLATADAPAALHRLRAAGLQGPAGLGGPAGFAAAHRQALLAARIATSRGSGLVDVRSAALEALALGDARTAADVARAELGPLAAEPGRHGALVETLEAWFAARESVAGAAATLGVAPRTVSYRLRRVEDLLGHPVAARRAELETALRVHRLFAGPPAPPAG